jgi:glycosyltransferase involved in cell wall biosynthesis
MGSGPSGRAGAPGRRQIPLSGETMSAAPSGAPSARGPARDLIDLELEGVALPSPKKFPSGERAKLKAQIEAIRSTDDLAPALQPLLALIRAHPRDEGLQRLVATALGRVQDARAAAVWRGIDRRFPKSDTAPVRVARDLYKASGAEAAEAYIRERLVPLPDLPDNRFVLARAYIEMRKGDVADDILRAIIEHPDSGEALLVKTMNLLLKRGRLTDAENAAQLLVSKFGDSHRPRLHEVDHTRRTLGEAHDDAAVSIMTTLIGKVMNVVRTTRPRESLPARSPRSLTSLGPVVMINGSLAPGGAERQFMVTALGLHRASVSGSQIGGVDIHGPLTFISRSLASRAGDDFYLPRLRDAGVRIHQYSDFEPYGGRARRSLSRLVSPLLPLLPAATREGIVRLADVLRYLSPDVVHIWQDGSILATGAAAALAGVPRIVLGARTMPPVDRHDREKPEYFPIFRGLLGEPGVTLVSNSRLVAGRYAEWLQLDPCRVRVIPNGVEPPSAEPRPESLALTAGLPPRGERFVVGAVMRFAAAKRPLLWIDCAAVILARCPQAYFVMVGQGPLLEAAIERARTLGVRDRILFTGATPDVGFWFSQMDVFLLLSQFEGLPNVLIEAQMCGVPVVTTPAGGSAETVDAGRTGTVLDSVDIEDPTVVADAVLSWRRDPESRAELEKTLKEWAGAQFSVDRMLELTVQTYMEASSGTERSQSAQIRGPA